MDGAEYKEDVFKNPVSNINILKHILRYVNITYGIEITGMFFSIQC